MELIEGIKLACVLVATGIVCMVRAVPCWIVHFVPCLVQLNYKLKLLSLLRRTHVAFNRVLRDQLCPVKQLHLPDIVRYKVELSCTGRSLKVTVHKDEMDRVDRLEVHANVHCCWQSISIE